MEVLTRVFNFYLNSSIHVALSAYAFTWITLFEFGIANDENSLNVVFFATVTGYNFVKYFGVAKFHHRSLANWLKAIQVFSLAAFLALGYYAFRLHTNTLVLIALLGGMTFLYAIPLLPRTYFIDDKKNLRQISGLKIYVIGFVWSLATVILPLINNKIALDFNVIVVALQRLLIVIALMLPFEIRDLNYDSLKLGTIPQKIGIKNTKIIGILLLLIFLVLEFVKDNVSSGVILATLLFSLIALLSLIFSNKNQSKYYSAFWVESLPLVWLGILLVLG